MNENLKDLSRMIVMNLNYVEVLFILNKSKIYGINLHLEF